MSSRQTPWTDSMVPPSWCVRLRSSQLTGVQISSSPPPPQPLFAADRVVSASHAGNNAFQTLAFNMSSHPDWNGTVTALRLDPVFDNGITFAVDWIRGPGP